MIFTIVQNKVPLEQLLKRSHKASEILIPKSK
jgi:hypothetical protein